MQKVAGGICQIKIREECCVRVFIAFSFDNAKLMFKDGYSTPPPLKIVKNRA